MNKLESIKERLSNATPGPWTLYKCEHYLMEEDRACGINGHSFDCSYDECHHPLNLNDGELIANAPADIEYLLQRLERYEKALSDIAFGRVEGDYSDVKYFARESLNEE